MINVVCVRKLCDRYSKKIWSHKHNLDFFYVQNDLINQTLVNGISGDTRQRCRIYPHKWIVLHLWKENS
jgi:hypothetical protein